LIAAAHKAADAEAEEETPAAAGFVATAAKCKVLEAGDENLQACYDKKFVGAAGQTAIDAFTATKPLCAKIPTVNEAPFTAAKALNIAKVKKCVAAKFPTKA